MLEDIGTLRKFKDGNEIFHEDSPGSTMYFIASGKIRLARANIREGRDIVTTLAVLNKGDFFGEMALFEYGRRSATATAVGDVELRIITRKDLEAKIKEHPEIAFYFLDRISKRMRRTDELIELLLVREKLAEELYDKVNALRYPEFL